MSLIPRFRFKARMDLMVYYGGGVVLSALSTSFDTPLLWMESGEGEELVIIGERLARAKATH